MRTPRAGDVGRRGQGRRPGQRGEVLEPHLDAHRPARAPRLPRPPGGPLGQCEQLPGQERRVGGSRLSKVVSAPIEESATSVCTRPGVPPQASSCSRVPLAAPEGPISWADPSLAISPTVADARAIPAARRSADPTPHSARTGSGCSSAMTSAGGTTQQPVGLGQAGGELGDELGGRRADRRGQPELVPDPPPQRLARWRRAGRTAGGRRPRRGTPRRPTAARPAG